MRSAIVLGIELNGLGWTGLDLTKRPTLRCAVLPIP